MAQLSQHFSLEEMTATNTGLPNQPATEADMDNLRRTANAMEGVRALLGRPIRISSGYRSPAVNKKVRGVSTSAHCQGYAVDFTCPQYGSPAKVAKAIAESDIQFDQCIYEGTWVHLSFDPRMRGEVLTARFIKGKAVYSLGINP